VFFQHRILKIELKVKGMPSGDSSVQPQGSHLKSEEAGG